MADAGADAAAAAAAASAAAAAAAAAAAPNWTTGLDAEIVGHAQNAGWDKLKPDEAARAAVKSHLELQKFQGVPADRLVKLPGANAQLADWVPVYQKLGAPADKKDYDFSGVKFADGTALDDSFVGFLRDQAAALHLPKASAAEFGKSIVKWMDDAETTEKTIATAAGQTEKAKLIEQWGARADLNTQLAKRGAELLGFSAEAVAAMEGKVGYAVVMQNFLKAAAKLGEDVFITNGGANGNPGVISKEQATARKAALMSDPAWVKSYMDGDVTKNNEFKALLQIEVGGP